MKKLILMLAVSILGIAGATQAASPLVDVAWVTANTGKAGVVFLDFRGNAAYLRGHVPGAIRSNYGKDGWREKKLRWYHRHDSLRRQVSGSHWWSGNR